MSEIKGLVHSLESFGSVDGPGIRFLVFLQGCHLRCQFCHNADTWSLKGNETTKEYTAEELLKQAIKYKSYWKNNGGITVSGGEPLLQIDFLIELFTLAKQKGINTCIDTAGQPFTYEEPFFSKFEKLMSVTDILLVDLKHIDDDIHKKLTGYTNENIKQLFAYLNEIHKPIWVRHVLVPGITDHDDYLKQSKAFLDQFDNIEKIDILPYHTLGRYKWEELGYKYPLEGVESPSKERIENAQRILCLKEK